MAIRATGKIVLTEFTVEGKGEFPFDMLRYDRCWPKAEATDVVNLTRQVHPHSPLFKSERKVTLVSIDGMPTVARWESFGWKVVSLG